LEKESAQTGHCLGQVNYLIRGKILSLYPFCIEKWFLVFPGLFSFLFFFFFFFLHVHTKGEERFELVTSAS
jgi:hypothetical protein